MEDNVKEVNEYLDKQIAEKRVVLDNLNAQEKTAKVKAEYDVQFAELQKLKKKQGEEKRLATLRDALTSREYGLTRRKQALDRREKDIAEREKDNLYLENKKLEVLKQRQAFLNYQAGKERELAIARGIIEEANVKEDVIKQKESDLFSLEDRVLAKSAKCDKREEGLLNREKELKIREDNLTATKGEENA